MQTLMAGTVFAGTYRVERLLGSGGMADVYLVAHTRLPRKFALKVLRTVGQVEGMAERFKREAEILASLRHPHLVDVVDWNVSEDGQAYLVMELLEGEELTNFLRRTGPLRLPVALHICAQIGEALMAAHRVGVVHRDLKPANIFLCTSGPVPNFVKVLDFGIAKFPLHAEGSITNQSMIMGTPGYMAPEQIIGANEQIDHRCDQFALAAILYEMLAGHPPFHRPGELPGTILERVMYEQPPPLMQVPTQINDALLQGLRKDPSARFPDIRFFLAAISATSHTIYLPPLTTAAPSSSSLRPGEVQQRTRQVGRVTVTGLVLVGLIVVLLIAWRILPSRRPPIVPVQTASSAESVPVELPTQKRSMITLPVTVQPSSESILSPDASATEVPHRALSAPPSAEARRTEAVQHAEPRPVKPGRLSFQVVLNNPEAPDPLKSWQTQVIRQCAERHLRGISSLAPGTRLDFVRVDSLLFTGAVTEAVSRSGLDFCLKKAFVRPDQTPAKAQIRVLRGE